MQLCAFVCFRQYQCPLLPASERPKKPPAVRKTGLHRSSGVSGTATSLHRRHHRVVDSDVIQVNSSSSSSNSSSSGSDSESETVPAPTVAASSAAVSSAPSPQNAAATDILEKQGLLDGLTRFFTPGERRMSRVSLHSRTDPLPLFVQHAATAETKPKPAAAVTRKPSKMKSSSKHTKAKQKSQKQQKTKSKQLADRLIKKSQAMRVRSNKTQKSRSKTKPPKDGGTMSGHVTALFDGLSHLYTAQGVRKKAVPMYSLYFKRVPKATPPPVPFSDYKPEAKVDSAVTSSPSKASEAPDCKATAVAQPVPEIDKLDKIDKKRKVKSLANVDDSRKRSALDAARSKSSTTTVMGGGGRSVNKQSTAVKASIPLKKRRDVIRFSLSSRSRSGSECVSTDDAECGVAARKPMGSAGGGGGNTAAVASWRRKQRAAMLALMTSSAAVRASTAAAAVATTGVSSRGQGRAGLATAAAAAVAVTVNPRGAAAGVSSAVPSDAVSATEGKPRPPSHP